MPLAASSGYSYPLLSVFWTILEIFLWVIWIWIAVGVIFDIFRSHDLSGWGKAAWSLFLVFILPMFGVLVYLIVRGGKMHERAVQQAQHDDQQFRSYVQEAAGSQSPADQLTKLADLRDRGHLGRGVRPREGKDPVLSGAARRFRRSAGLGCDAAERLGRRAPGGWLWTVLRSCVRHRSQAERTQRKPRWPVVLRGPWPWRAAGR